MKKIEHLPINWVNGLKLNNGHFFETYYNMVDTVRQNREECLTSHSYGFGENLTDTKNPIEWEIKGDSIETFSIRLKSCNAVTRSGLSIIYDQSLYGDYIPAVNTKDVDADLKKDQVFYIVLSVNPYKLLPVGMPDPEVTPLHHPYALPEVNLQLLTEVQVNQNFMEYNCIIAGKCIVEGGLFDIDKQYIPPVQRICHDERLLSFLDIFQRHVKVIYDYALSIYRKNVTDARRDRLVENTFALCNVVQDFYNMSIFDLEHLSSEQPPIYLVHLANGLANKLLTTLRIMPEKESEYLLQYFNEWTNISPADFLQTVGEVGNITYKHTDIFSSLKSISSLMKQLERVFKKMSELEYVGLMRENIILSEDSDGNTSENDKKSWKVWE